jgi:hypothetical protein
LRNTTNATTTALPNMFGYTDPEVATGINADLRALLQKEPRMKQIHSIGSALTLTLTAMLTTANAQPVDPDKAERKVTTQLNRQQATMHRRQRLADQAAYDAAVRAHHQKVQLRNIHYLNQRKAYTTAMAAWHQQVEDCKAGDKAACNAPTPDPVNFF